ncbi:alpha-glycosidase [Paenibacillus pasadenensis]|uniref:Neopullulanase n=1 Tax=Paenibacillus pasadenensis TaxID=217090 RepID=A0A2N5N365_9BACL|nr:alpha-glycosidase [Paenibacillus pasadenensis]PLT44762.1 Neopullulanase [Paenibacillus pasadenensis]
MNLEAIYHRPRGNWAYAYDKATLHIRLRTKKDDLDEVVLIHGDKYAWERTLEKTFMAKLPSDERFDYWQAAVQPSLRRMKYGFELRSAGETLYFEEKGFREDEPSDPDKMFDFPYLNGADVFSPPDWVKEAVFYQIFPERFANGDPSNDPEGVEPWGGKPTPKNFFGGDLQGVIDHLDHLQELGVNAIYFNPLFQATTNHKYDTSDYMKVDAHFGDNALLKRLVDACHERGIRVMLDAVFNHSGKEFEPFRDVREKGKDSKYADWFHVMEWPIQVKDGRPTYETFAFEPLMPKLNTENPEVKDYLLGVARYWIEEMGIDGWRLDVANEVDMAFWREFRRTVKDVNPDAYILGEMFHDALPWLGGDQFDAVMNYPFTHLVIDYAGKGIIGADRFADKIGELMASYPDSANEVAFNLLGSHDTERLLTLCGGDKERMKLATLLQFVFPGAPCVYYGDEIGLDGAGDPDCRKCMEWDESKQDRELLGFFQRVISLRKEHRALRTGKLGFLHAAEGGSLLVLERKDEQEHFLIAVNPGAKAASVQLDVHQAAWSDLLGGGELRAKGGKLSVELAPGGFLLLRAASAISAGGFPSGR